MENDKNIYLTTGLNERLKKQLTLKKQIILSFNKNKQMLAEIFSKIQV